jgi:hypothetical protein
MLRAFLVAVSVSACVAGGTLFARAQDGPGREPGASVSLAEQVRYIGRDPYTGLAATVGDRFIAEVEEAYEEYYEEDREPVPPPPVEGLDIARLRVPAIGIDAPVARFGLDAAGRLDVPQDTSTIGWNPAYTSLPGEGRSTFFAAHYEYGGVPGVFFGLFSLAANDVITVVLSDGAEHAYEVVSVLDYPLETIDMGALLTGLEDGESLVLMTCSGPGDGGRYPLRTVVIARAR